MRATDTRSLTFDLDLDLDLPDLRVRGLDLPGPVPRTTSSQAAAPVVPPAGHRRRGRRVQAPSAPRPRLMRKPGGVR